MSPSDVLEVLERQFELAWPPFNQVSQNEYYALRLVVLCERATGDWGLVFEQVAGLFLGEDSPASLGVATTILGPSVPSHAHFVGPKRPCGLMVDESGTRLSGPAGELVFDESMVAKFDLRPELVCNLDHVGHPHQQLIRAYLARYPGSLFGPLAETVRALSGTEEDVLLTADAFEQIVDPAYVPNDRFAMRPSASPVYRSLAEAIASRDATRFQPGSSNLDWRLWARSPVHE